MIKDESSLVRPSRSFNKDKRAVDSDLRRFSSEDNSLEEPSLDEELLRTSESMVRSLSVLAMSTGVTESSVEVSVAIDRFIGWSL